MKKYLPSADEIVPGVIIFVIGMLVWSFAGPALQGLVAKAKSKVS